MCVVCFFLEYPKLNAPSDIQPAAIDTNKSMSTAGIPCLHSIISRLESKIKSLRKTTQDTADQSKKHAIWENIEPMVALKKVIKLHLDEISKATIASANNYELLSRINQFQTEADNLMYDDTVHPARTTTDKTNSLTLEYLKNKEKMCYENAEAMSMKKCSPVDINQKIWMPFTEELTQYLSANPNDQEAIKMLGNIPSNASQSVAFKTDLNTHKDSISVKVNKNNISIEEVNKIRPDKNIDVASQRAILDSNNPQLTTHSSASASSSSAGPYISQSPAPVETPSENGDLLFKNADKLWNRAHDQPSQIAWQDTSAAFKKAAIKYQSEAEMEQDTKEKAPLLRSAADAFWNAAEALNSQILILDPRRFSTLDARRLKRTDASESIDLLSLLRSRASQLRESLSAA